MLMAGAAGRNLGKTEFLCQAIAAQSQHQPVIGIKITAFDDEDDQVVEAQMKTKTYRTLEGPYAVTRETTGDDRKDTHRMFRAGASQVYWLRSLRSHLGEGIDALLAAMQEDGLDIHSACLVCESAGARRFIEPGLFFVIRQMNDTLKPSAAEVAKFADQLVLFNRTGWDVNPSALQFERGRWGMRESAAAIVLSGGSSVRMGEDKSLLKLGDQRLIEKVTGQLIPHFQSVVISGSPEKYAFTGLAVIPDCEPNGGPLVGLYSCLSQSEQELNFVTTCDVPDVHLPFVRRLLREADGVDAVVAVAENQRIQPLFAVYRKSVVETIATVLASGKRSMHALLDQLNVRSVPLSGDWYHNLNTHDDVVRYHGDLP